MVAVSNPVSPTTVLKPDTVSPTTKRVSELLFSAAETAIKVELLFVWNHVFGCEAFFDRTCPMVKRADIQLALLPSKGCVRVDAQTAGATRNTG